MWISKKYLIFERREWARDKNGKETRERRVRVEERKRMEKRGKKGKKVF